MRSVPSVTGLLLRLLRVSLLFILLLASLPTVAQGGPPAMDSQGIPVDELVGADFVDGEILVRYRGAAPSGRLSRLLKDRHYASDRVVRGLGVQVLKLPKNVKVEDAIAELQGDPDVEFVEPNYVMRILTIDDPGLANQWSPDKIAAPAAWNITEGDPTIVIGVVDTGVDYFHSELSPNIWARSGEVPGNGVDDDGNGYVDDIRGWDFHNNDADPMDDHFHGTHVSGIAAAAPTDNPDGIVGVCPRCTIMPVKVLGANGSGSLDAVANGIIYAADNGAAVINMSLAGTSTSPTLDSAVSYAWNHGVLVVAGAGNKGSSQPMYPAAHANAMAVAATNSDDFRSCFSSYGDNYISVAAPGELIYATTLRDASGNDTYGTYSGTSMATPHVSGLAGLLFSQDPSRTNAQVRGIIESTAVDLGPAGTDAFFGHGRINALRALQGDTSATTPPTGRFADTLSATALPNGRKLVRDADGALHWVWHGTSGGYRILYATSTDGVTWSPQAVVFASDAETASPALAADDSNLYLAFSSKEGTGSARVWFARKPLAGGAWSVPVVVMGGSHTAARPSLYLDPGNGRLHLAAGSDNDAPFVYYASSPDGGATWGDVKLIGTVSSAEESARYAAVHANGDRVYVVARSTEPTLWGIMANFRTFATFSLDGGSSWSEPDLLSSFSSGASNEPGLSLAGVGDRLYLAYGHNGDVLFRRSDDGMTWSDSTEVGAGAWPSITQADDGRAWVAWEDEGNLWLRRYAGGWDSPEWVLEANGLSKTYFPNLKLGASGDVVEWVTTHCSGAPFTLSHGSRPLGEMPINHPLFFSAPDYAVNEDAGSVAVQVRLEEASERTVTVDYSTSDGTAVSPTDYTATEGTLTFAAGETSQTFDVVIKDDSTAEAVQTINLALANPVNATLGSPSTATISIADNDTSPMASFSLSQAYVNESAGACSVGVRLSAASDYEVTVDYATTDGTATAGADYAATSGTILFAPGEVSKSFSLGIVDDVSAEADETVGLSLSNPTNATLGNASSTLIIDDNDAVKLAVSLYTVKENVGEATITAKLSAASGLEVRVDYATGDGTATPGVDYTPASGTLVFAPGETSRSFVVPIADDVISEERETVPIVLSNPLNAELGSPAVATLNIDDNDTVVFSLTSYTVKENVGEATINVRMVAASDLVVQVEYTTSDGTAKAGQDYTAASGTLVFAPGETSRSFTVGVTDDFAAEPRETVSILLSDPVNAGLGSPSIATLNIDDNDTLDFASSAYTAVENAGEAVFAVKLSAASDHEVRVDFSTSDATATAGVDYLAASGTLVFAPGETSKSFAVPIIDDVLPEGDETVNLALSNPVNAELGSPSTSVLNIDDNDTIKFVVSLYTVKENVGQVDINVKLNAASDLPASVDYATQDASATAGEDYVAASGTLVFAPGVTSAGFSITLLDDLISEEREVVTIALSNPVNAGLGTPSVATLNIDDNDTIKFSVAAYSVKENDGQATITVKMVAASELVVSVDYATSDGTATAGADYLPASGTLTFAPGETSKTFEVVILTDDDAEGSETILLALSNPVNAGLGSPSEAVLTIGANDSVRFSLSYYSALEDVGQATITAKLSAASDQVVSVDYATSDGTATAGSDYVATNGTVTFAPGETSKSFAVTILDDLTAEATETVLLALSNPVNAGLGSPATSSLSIMDNDALKFSSSIYTGYEKVGTATITVRLSVASDQEVQVDYATVGGGTATEGEDYLSTSGTLIFAPGQTSRTFTVSIIDDVLAEAKESIKLELSNPVNAGLGMPSSSTLYVTDNDALRFALSYYYVYENVGSASITVRLSAASNVQVSVDYATVGGGTATEGEDYLATSGTLVFSPGQTSKTFAVTIIDDAINEGNETIKLALSNPVNAGLGSPSLSTLTIRANDES